MTLNSKPAPYRTSLTHPLRIDVLQPRHARGRIGLTICPGKHCDQSITGAPWRRDLALDMAAIDGWFGAGASGSVVSLMKPEEYVMLAVRGLPQALPSRLTHWNLPIVDVSVPDAEWYAQWRQAMPRLVRELVAGRDVLIHCRGGLGRSGLVAALLLVELGEEAEVAIKRVRAARLGAIETPEQEDHVRHYVPIGTSLDSPAERRQRYRDCLVGGAVGDALGAPVEFMTRRDIRTRFGARGLQDLVAGAWPVGTITDDTQMTLFTAEALLREPDGDDDTLLRALSLAYQHWLATQGERSPLGEKMTGATRSASALLADRRLHARRAPGNTCLGALRASRSPDALADNDSKGCGTVMRVAPIGLFAAAREAGSDPSPSDVHRAVNRAWDLGILSAAVTHGNVDGQAAAGLVAALVAALVIQPDPLLAVLRVQAALGHRKDAQRAMLPLLERVLVLAEQAGCADGSAGAPARDWNADAHADVLASLGAGWVADEAAAMAIYCLLVAPDFRRGVLLAADIDGDSDSVAAVAGNLLGLSRLGKAMPKAWRDAIELRDRVEEMADGLAALSGGVVACVR